LSVNNFECNPIIKKRRVTKLKSFVKKETPSIIPLEIVDLWCDML